VDGIRKTYDKVARHYAKLEREGWDASEIASRGAHLIFPTLIPAFVPRVQPFLPAITFW
jgi:hypothetical protein